MVTSCVGGAGRRPVCVLAALLALGAWGVAPASADVFGAVAVSPLSGTDSTLFGGVVTGATCPAGTSDSYFDVVGDDIGVGAARGQGQMGFLGPGSKAGRANEAFVGASVANLRAVSAGSFAASGRYRIRLRCETGAITTDTYETILDYTAGGAGSFRIQAPQPARVSPAPSGSPGAASILVSPTPVGGVATAASGGVGSPAPGAATAPASASAGEPSPGRLSADGLGGDSGPGDRSAETGSALVWGGWLALAAAGVAGGLLLVGRKRGWRFVSSRAAGSPLTGIRPR